MLRGLHFKVLIVAGLLSLIPAAARATDNTQGTACTGTSTAAISGSTTGASVVSPAGGNNLVCIGGTWQYPVYQFGSTSAACSSTNAGAVQYSGGAMQYCNGSAWLPFSSSCYGSNSGSDTSLASNLIAYWKLDEDTGTTVYDATENTLPAGFSGTVGSQWVMGKVGYALNFNGTNDLVTIAQNSLLEFTGSTTLSAWVNPSTTTSTSAFVTKGTDGGGGGGSSGWSMWLQQNGSQWETIAVTTNPSLAGYSASGGTVTTGTWTHIVGVFDNSAQTLTLFVNGSNVASTSTGSTLRVSNGNSYIGGSYTNNGGLAYAYYSGAVDEVGIWNTALTSSRVSSLYNTGLGNTYGAMVCLPLINSNGGFIN